MKKILSLLIVLAFFVGTVTPVLAVGNAFGQGMNSSGAAEKQRSRLDAQTGNLNTRAANEISRRITSLNNLLNRINNFKNISATQRAAFIAQVQSEISALNTLQTKISADTDIATLRADVKSIVDAYRVYALFMPQLNIIAAGDRILTIADDMTTHASTLEAKINAQQAKGQNVADLLTLLSDMKAKIADAKTQAQAAIDAVTPLTPAGFPGNKATLQGARQMLTTAIHDLNTARQDARQIIVGLMKLGKTPTVTPSVTTTP
ncbi:MAG TPA: hypothetical protein VF810_03430 [Patescibacteria group bacterium]